MSLRVKIIIFLFITLPFSALAQKFERSLNGIPFRDSSGIIQNTMSGGHNNIEHQLVDIDGDGDLDLVYLDSDKTYGWYENTGDQFSLRFTLSFDSIPGLKFSDWFYLLDIDVDGDYDIFTGGAPALIEFRRNTGTAINPFFELEIDTLYDNENNLIFSEFGSNPVFTDIDNDGDYDFFSGNSIGTVTFYENTGSNTSFNLKFITHQWQDIIIIGGGTISLKPDIQNPVHPELHGASSLDFADIDNDKDMDLFWGDFFSKSLYFIQNNGTAVTAEMDTPYTYSTYPKNEDSIRTSGFNMPRLADIDNDNDLDLFVTVLFDQTVPQSLMFFKNEGNAKNPDFILENENLLKTLDVGIHSSPVFIDIDEDGDLDLFTGSGRSPNGILYFFENTGTSTRPSYLLIDSVYFGIENDLTITPSFGDLDEDGDYDLVIGEFLGRLSFYENTGTASSPEFQFVEQIKDTSGNFISTGNIARPFLIDIDNDLDLDLITGGFNGQIRLYKNIGTRKNYSFIFEPSYFSLDVGDISTPFLIDYDNDGDYDLFAGSSDRIHYYQNDGDNINPAWTLITEKFLNQSFGGYAAPCFVDIDDDSDLDLFIGNIKGGLYFFENKTVTSVELKENLPDDLNIEAYPNPFNSTTTIIVNIERTEKAAIFLFNTLGQKLSVIHEGFLYEGKNQFTWDGKNDRNNNLPSGNYFVVIRTSDRFKAIKITLLK
jgi:hypothetical protein